ncbi:general transcription factor IIH subunit 1 [Strongylocentrotus purpuratus]|uniref:BSD domain-containing protein n=1 Tax=Strongylocentrotus purpuratus TaxID=7668 RepID=A0A7M7P5H4_STRPU|nr:general transcription factor IIH subunit 1 [Strongylocentrotus purpuratus]
MAMSSEEVLLVVAQVRSRKSNGSLYLMGKRLAWQEDNKEVFTVSHYYADVKQQRISQDTSSKVQLQILLHNGSSTKFHFANRDGSAAQKQDRNDVKELLQQLLPKFRSQASRELEEKNKMLKDDPELFQLYRDLVMSGVMTADEFWASRINMSQQESAAASSASTSASDGGQGVGVSAAFLSDIKPQTDGCNGVKYNLTADIIDSIFRIYPAVRKKHLESVPHTMSEKEFWTCFFQSQYFHRDRINAGSKDLFAECAKKDEKDMTEEANQTVQDPLLDIQGLSDNTINEEFGFSLDNMMKPNAVNKSIIKRFNHHNTRVLAASESNKRNLADDTDAPSTSSQSLSQNSNTNHRTDGGGGDGDESSAKKARLREAIEIEDLSSSSKQDGVSLKLQRTDRYYHGPTVVQSTDYFSSEVVMGALRAVQSEVMSSVPNLHKVISSNTARSVMGELTPGGALMASLSTQPVHTMYSPETQKEVKRLYSALAELLRHFWSCFPVTNRSLEEKVFRMKGTLEQFHAKKIKPFKDTLAKQHIGLNLVNHMEELLQTAYKKYANWQSKKLGAKLS